MLYMSTFAKKVTSAVLTSAVVFSTVGAGINGVNAALMNQIDAANKLANENVIVDQSSNPSAYRLADTIQRKEALKVMMNLSDKTVSQGACTSPFADIADTDWACKYAVAALNAGFIAPNTNFRPDDNVSKIEALKMVMKARGIEKDTSASDWRAGYVNAAVAADIAESFSDYNTAATRGTMFVWAAEAIEISEDDNLGLDLDNIINGDDDSSDDSANEDDNSANEDNNSNNEVSASDELVVSLNPESPADGLAPADTNRVPLLKFDVKAGSEDVTLNEATLNFIGLGDYKKLKEVAIYNSIGEKVSKTKNFSEVERKISFDKNIVVEAGTTMTLTVAGKLATDGADNATYGVKLVDLKASSNVVGEDLVGALLVPATFANVAKLKVNADKQSGKITIGDTETLVKFDLEETEDNEDVIVKTITLHVEGTADEDDLSNLEVYIEGTKIDTDLTVNDDEEIVMPVDYNLAADDKVTVEVKGSITGSVGDTIDFVFESNDDIYAIGATSGMPVEVSTSIASEDLSTARLIEGSEINVSFEKSDKDEATPDSDDVEVGTLKLLALTDAYEIKKLTVTVKNTNNTKAIEDVIENLELGGVSYDSVSNENTTEAVYTFEDIDLKANEEQNLALTFDVLDDNTLNGTNLDFQVAITKVNDDVEDKDYTDSSTPDLASILSSTALDNKDIDIETGSITIANVSVIDRDLVIGNGVETVLYKAKITTGDAEDITINDFNLINAGSTITEDLDKVIDTATLNIGGKTFSADVDNDSVDFTSIAATIPADSHGVEVLVTAVLKDNDNVTDGQYIKLALDTANLDIDDSKGDSLPTTSVITAAANNKLTKTILKSEGTFEFAIIKNGDNKDEIDNVVLAGSNDVAIAEFKMEADLEDIDVNELKIKIPVVTTTPANPAISTTVAGTEGNYAVPLDYGYGVTKVELTTSAELETGDKVYVTVNGTTYTKEVTSSAVAALDSLGTDIKDGEANVANYSVDGNTKLILETADDATQTIDITYPAINSNGTAKTLTYKTVQSPKHVGNMTVTLSRAVKAGDSVSITVNGQTYSYTSAADNDLEVLANQINADAANANVASATESTDGTVITIAGKADGTPVEVTASATPKPAVVSGDVSDTLSNVRLMDGSRVIASTDDIELVGSNTVITFNDFTVEDGDSVIEGTIVADITKYTTDGDETSAVLGDIKVSPFTPADADVEGISSDNVITAGVITGNTTSEVVSIVPATVDVAVTQTFGDTEPEAKLTFTINKGNNVFDDDDIKITSLKLTANGAPATNELSSIENDDNNTIAGATPGVNGVFTPTTPEAIVSGDVWTFNVDTTNGKDKKIKLVQNGVNFTVDGHNYKSSNDDELSFGTYTN